MATPIGVKNLVSTFGGSAAAKFATGAGEPEDHLRGPLGA